MAAPVASGVRSNSAAESRVVFNQTVATANAVWTRVFFSDLVLDGASTVRLTSLTDGEVQELDAHTARVWNNSSAYFNGDRVLVELVAGPNTQNNHLAIDQVAVELDDGGSGGIASYCGICGTDDRVPSNVNWAGRLMPTGCSASIFTTCSCLVSAGHCATSGMVVQFNVPNSNSNCTLVNPPVADQFPIVSYQYQYVDIGADWAVLQAGNNNLGQSPYQRYGQMQPINGNPALVGNTVGLYGYGIDTDCIYSQRQQYSTGNVSVVAPTYFLFSADIATGSSGTGVIRNGELIGVVTNCMDGCPNVATSTNVVAFVNARASLCGSCSGSVVPCPSDVNGDRQVNSDDLVTVITHWGTCPASPSMCVGDIVSLSSHVVNVDDLVAVLTAWGGCP